MNWEAIFLVYICYTIWAIIGKELQQIEIKGQNVQPNPDKNNKQLPKNWYLCGKWANMEIKPSDLKEIQVKYT